MQVVFGVTDVHACKKELEPAGMKLGVGHRVDGIEFVKAKDPADNSLQICIRGMKEPG